jgi:choline dehydrogenase-like flavoprotein
MNSLGNQLFARPAFSLQQDRGFAVTHTRNGLVKPPHRFAVPNQVYVISSKAGTVPWASGLSGSQAGLDHAQAVLHQSPRMSELLVQRTGFRQG